MTFFHFNSSRCSLHINWSKNIVSQFSILHAHSIIFVEFYQFYWLSNGCGSAFVTLSVTARYVTHFRDIVTWPNPNLKSETFCRWKKNIGSRSFEKICTSSHAKSCKTVRCLLHLIIPSNVYLKCAELFPRIYLMIPAFFQNFSLKSYRARTMLVLLRQRIYTCFKARFISFNASTGVNINWSW